ncbi:MAG: methylenetetrahydrofolate reductase [NAD(P)H] [Ruminococcaceae bacterium]|nr:methylenetetrahydrofolate reductase [NAD(P)H] [Oscillospiraceae bacterium]
MKTNELFRDRTVLSFEVFPPKPTSDETVIYKTLEELAKLRPDCVSVTYGAGGGANCEKTVQIASDVKNKYGIESVAHLPCVYLSENDAVNILDKLKANGIENILALRGDISENTAPNGRFSHANELIEFICERYDFNIITACYPEKHFEAESLSEDLTHLKNKVDSGAAQLITQLFLDNRYFYDFLEQARKIGINVPVEAGIMPVVNAKQITRMVKLCGIKLPEKFRKVIEKYGDNPTAMYDAGIAYAIDQIVDLLSQGVDGIHLYTMNNAYVAERIYNAVYSLISVKTG